MDAALRHGSGERRRRAAARPRCLRFRSGATLLLLTVLSACTAADGRPVPVQTESGARGATARTIATLRRPPPVAPASAKMTAAPRASVGIGIDAARMLGLDGTGVAALLGEPAFVRRDPPAEVWQYHGTGCVLDLFLYDEPGGGHRVAHVEARTGTAAPTPVEPCITGLLTGPRTPRAS